MGNELLKKIELRKEVIEWLKGSYSPDNHIQVKRAIDILESELAALDSQIEEGKAITAEEILNKHNTSVFAVTRREALDAMQEYADQSRLSEPSMPEREELIKCIDWITDTNSPYAVMYGNHFRFATSTKDYTIKEVVDQYLNSKQSEK